MSVNLSDNFEKVLLAFNKHEVEYMIAGGYAVIFYGYGRTTGDMDLWIRPSPENKNKIIDAFNEMQFPKELTEYLVGIDFTKPFAVKIGNDPMQVDIFNAITGVRYDKANKKSKSYKFSSELEVRFIPLEDLIVNKMLTGRLQDKADVEQLQKINRNKKK